MFESRQDLSQEQQLEQLERTLKNCIEKTIPAVMQDLLTRLQRATRIIKDTSRTSQVVRDSALAEVCRTCKEGLLNNDPLLEKAIALRNLLSGGHELLKDECLSEDDKKMFQCKIAEAILGESQSIEDASGLLNQYINDLDRLKNKKESQQVHLTR